MCKDCGCSLEKEEVKVLDENTQKKVAREIISKNPQLNDGKTIAVIKKILDKNDQEAEHNRLHLDENNVLGINLMSSPGSGKTSLLESIVPFAKFTFGVIEGDLETNKDADRLKAKGIQAVQIQTGSSCHLDAFMTHKAMHNIDLKKIDVCFVENVGNLVCPASYDVGTHLNVVLVSVPEGEDKIVKYPVMFRAADLIIFTKTDLLDYFDYDLKQEKEMAKKLNPKADILEFSTKDESSVKGFLAWIENKRKMS